MEKVNFLYKKRQKIVVEGGPTPHGQASQGTPSVRIPSKKQKKHQIYIYILGSIMKENSKIEKIALFELSQLDLHLSDMY